MNALTPRALLLAAALLPAACCARPGCPPPCPSPSPAAAVAAERPPAPRLVATEEVASQVMIEATVVRIPAAQAERLLGSPRGTGARSTEVLPAADAQALLARVTKDPTASLLQMPTILTISEQDASVSIGESYDDSLHRPPGDGYESALHDPAWAGQELRLRPKVLPDGTSLSLDLSLIVREMPTKGTKPDLPRLVAEQIHARTAIERMPSGDSVLSVVAGGGPTLPGDRILLVVTPRILPSKAE